MNGAQDQGQPALYTDAIVSVEVSDADDQNPVFGQSRYWAHLPQPADEVQSVALFRNDSENNASF